MAIEAAVKPLDNLNGCNMPFSSRMESAAEDSNYLTVSLHTLMGTNEMLGHSLDNRQVPGQILASHFFGVVQGGCGFVSLAPAQMTSMRRGVSLRCISFAPRGKF